MEEKNIQRPFILEIDEAKSEIIQVINNAIRIHRLPCYIVDMILLDIGAQVKEGAKNELATAKAQIKQQEQMNGEEVA